jgi:alkylhydroperoxidase/carboxymuconolactone decarboxylase family protein YurZ
MRSFVLKDAELPRKYKECLYVAINVADRNIGAVKIHGKGALESGATKEEVLEAVLTAIMAGGFIAWVDVASVYDEL